MNWYFLNEKVPLVVDDLYEILINPRLISDFYKPYNDYQKSQERKEYFFFKKMKKDF